MVGSIFSKWGVGCRIKRRQTHHKVKAIWNSSSMSASKTALEYRQALSATDYPWLLTVLQSCMACKDPNTFSGSLRRVCQPPCVMLISSLSKSAWHTVMMFFSKFLLPGRPWVLPTLLSFVFSRSVVSASLRPPGLQHTRPPWPSPSPRTCWNSCPSSRWCHATISASGAPFSSRLQSFARQGLFQWVSSWHQVAKGSELQHLSTLWTFNSPNARRKWHRSPCHRTEEPQVLSHLC